MKIYFHDHHRTPDGYRRILYVFDRNRQPFSAEVARDLSAILDCDVCYGAPESCSLLIMSRADDQPTIRRVRKTLRRLVSYRIFRGGIFNPNLPVRPYDVWLD